jgi:hypothetical protein
MGKILALRQTARAMIMEVVAVRRRIINVVHTGA